MSLPTASGNGYCSKFTIVLSYWNIRLEGCELFLVILTCNIAWGQTNSNNLPWISVWRAKPSTKLVDMPSFTTLCWRLHWHSLEMFLWWNARLVNNNNNGGLVILGATLRFTLDLWGSRNSHFSWISKFFWGRSAWIGLQVFWCHFTLICYVINGFAYY